MEKQVTGETHDLDLLAKGEKYFAEWTALPDGRGLVIETRPKSKARPRMSKSGHVYTPKETKEYEKLISDAWMEQNPYPPFSNPVSVTMAFCFKRPKTHYDRHGVLKPDAPTRYTNTPDLDNVEKAVLDSLNGLAYTDDKLVWRKLTSKHWAADNLIRVFIQEDQ